MAGWQSHTGTAIALNRENVDTDQLIPARFMSTPRAAGYGDFLLHDLRRDPDGNLLPDFPLNRAPDASILVSRCNFGSGSSREAAVYALADFGFRVVVAPSFGDIFAANAVNNGVLPARVKSTDEFLDLLGENPLPSTADLNNQTITIGNHSLPFAIDGTWRKKLMNGWDDIDMTHVHRSTIASFRAQHLRATPWAFAKGQTIT